MLRDFQEALREIYRQTAGQLDDFWRAKTGNLFSGGKITATAIPVDGTTITNTGGVVAVAGGGGAVITTYSVTLGADVTLTNANQFYDVVSLSLPAGSFKATGIVQVLDTGAQQAFTAKIWDGTTVWAANGAVNVFAARSAPIPVEAHFTLTGTTTVKISVASTGATNGRVKAAVDFNSPGNFSSYLHVIKTG